MRLIDADDFWKPFEDEKEELENRTIKTSSALTALKFIDFIKRRLDLQPTIVQPYWIPCSEKPPKKNGDYLVTGKHGAVNKRKYEDGRWYGGWGVIAWRELPEPYRGKSDE